MPDPHEQILIIDYGSQYTQLIARRIRERGVYCSIVPPRDQALSRLTHSRAVKGLILSGGPASVTQRHAPLPKRELFDIDKPILGICYGMQAMVKLLGGTVKATGKREYGKAVLTLDEPDSLFAGARESFVSWMSHGDTVTKLPKGFTRLGHTDNTKNAAIGNVARQHYGIQFHPEVMHTEEGSRILDNFIFKICRCRGDWSIQSFIDEETSRIRTTVSGAKVVLGLSGGVDSSVAALLLHRAIGKQLTCIFVDNGLLRHGERQHVQETFGEHFKIRLRVVNAADRFLARLTRVTDPEKKRKIIGREFIRIFEEEALKIRGTEWLAQGTLYPDVIESVSAWGGPSATIKTHHNVGGLPKRMRLKLIEPLRHLFKDEVRALGKTLTLPDVLLRRHPFPGPGLAVRILGAVTAERLRMVREAEVRVEEEIRRAGLYDTLWQAFAVLLPVNTVGVMGDERTYEHVIAVRAVTSQDAMTADWAKLPADVLERIANRIINEVKGINRVVYDISSKPPSTIEWE